eukprot:GHVU01111018.1.p1 GENE.GHVU01111018.1~~GHVU01111018.1.p1  ORF type:complete len:110 (-),score=11.39 GHVU01111018.1:73-402(-)
MADAFVKNLEAQRKELLTAAEWDDSMAPAAKHKGLTSVASWMKTNDIDLYLVGPREVVDISFRFQVHTSRLPHSLSTPADRSHLFSRPRDSPVCSSSFSPPQRPSLLLR